MAGLDVVSVGPIFADEMGGELYAQLWTVLPNRAGDNFVVHPITLAHIQDTLLAQINRTALIKALETTFRSRADLQRRAAFAKYCRKEGPNERRMDQVVTGIISKRELN